MDEKVYEVREMVVDTAGYKYVGHYRCGFIDIIIRSGNTAIWLQPDNHFYLFDFFLCFGIDPEDGKHIEDLKGKKCRAYIDKQTGRLVKIKHLYRDDIEWKVKEDDN